MTVKHAQSAIEWISSDQVVVTVSITCPYHLDI